MSEGWVKLHRCLLDKPIWNCSTSEQKSIFITLLLLANRSEKEWEWQNKKFKCQPGQLVTSSTNLAKAAGCSRQNVRTALARFKKYEFLTYESTKTGILVTVVNWEKYQAKPEELTNKLTDDQPTGNQGVTTNKNHKNHENHEKNIIHTHFEQFWSCYPKKKSKGQALKAWEKIKPDDELLEKIIEALEDAKKSKDWLKENGKYIPYPATWLNAQGWEDEFEGVLEYDKYTAEEYRG